MQNGRLLFAHYALMPNTLGYCGGPESSELLDYCVEEVSDPGLDGLIRQFQVAYPYLQFIARSNRLEDPLDPRVVEAYWIGNELLKGVEAGGFYSFLEEAFLPRVPERLRKYLIGKVPEGARPHHSFHVLDVSMRTGALEQNVETLDGCRISWGPVLRVEDGQATVQVRPLVLENGRLEFGTPQERVAYRRMNGKGYLEDLRPGELVTLHWHWICDRITPQQARTLAQNTRYHLGLANRTL